MASIRVNGVKAGCVAVTQVVSINMLHGSSVPSSARGQNGAIYLQTGNDPRYTYDVDINGYCLNQYYIYNSGTYLSMHSSTFTKQYRGGAIAVEVHYSSGGTNWYGPILISTVENNVYITGNTSCGSATVDGTTWYITSTELWNNSNDPNHAYPILDIDYDLTQNKQQFVEDVLEASGYTQSISDDSVIGAFAKVDDSWQNLIGTEIDDIDIGSSGGGESQPFKYEITEALVQNQTANPVPVTATFAEDLGDRPYAFVTTMIDDNVYSNHDIPFNNGDWLFYDSQHGHSFTKINSNNQLTGYFPYSDGGAYFDYMGLIGMNKMPTSYCVKDKNDTNDGSIVLDKLYDHTILFVCCDSENDNATITMNGENIPLTMEPIAFSRYTYHYCGEIEISSTTISFTDILMSLGGCKITIFAFDE